MNTRIHTKVVTAIAAAAMVAAAIVPCASADSAKGTRIQIPPALSHLQEPGSTGWVPQSYGPAVQAGPKPEGMTTQQWQAELARGDALNQRYSLGAYAKTAGTSTATSPAALRVVKVAADGFDWGAAAIGAGVAFGLALAGVGALMAVRKRRTLAHV